MALAAKLIEKLFATHFCGDSTLTLSAEQLADFTTTLKQQLYGLPFIEIDTQHSVRPASDGQHVLSFYLQDLPLSGDGYAYYSNNNFTLKLNERSELIIANHQAQTTVASVDELMAFIADGQARMEQRVAEANKRQKLHKMRHGAMVAQIKRLARQDQFDYAYDFDASKLYLYLRLSDSELAELQLPYAQFDTVLPNLRTAIQSLRDLHAQGIRFQVTSAEKLRLRIEWITPDQNA